MKKIIYTQENGLVAIIAPASKKDIERSISFKDAALDENKKFFKIITDEKQNPIDVKFIDEQAYEDFVIHRSVPEGIDYDFVEDADIPTSREFRNAWIKSDKKIDFDLVKAKDIQFNKIRQKIQSKTLELDRKINFSIAKDDLEEKNKLIQEYKELADITDSLETAVFNSIDDIKNAFPDKLK